MRRGVLTGKIELKGYNVGLNIIRGVFAIKLSGMAIIN